jgi:hypothetical protein
MRITNRFSEYVGKGRNHNIPTIKMCIYSHFQLRKRPNNCFVSYRLTIIVVKIHVPPKETRTVTEVARVRQILKNVVYSASCKCGELAKLLSLLARIGYVCESNVLDGIFYLCLHTAIFVQAQTANIFARFFTFITRCLRLKTEALQVQK